MKITADWLLRRETRAVCAALESGGFRALFVGGCVRNALLGLAVDDVDIATDAVPETVTVLAENAGLKVIPTGIAHGTVTVMSHGIAHEVTTFRRDVETFGRHATVAYSRDISEDAHRRDFTMNALYATPEGDVLDPLGGLADLMARRVRFVGDPGARIAEDHLRILRFFRFHAWYGDPALGIDADGLAACATAADSVASLARERVGAEMRKLLAARDPAPAVAAMGTSGVLARILPGADARGLAPLVHLEGDLAPDWQRRLAALGGEGAATQLRLSRTEAGTHALIRAALGRDDGPAELAYRHGADLASDIILVRSALAGSPLPDGWQSDIARGGAARFPVTAADLMPVFSGPALGARLAELESLWVASGFALTREMLISRS